MVKGACQQTSVKRRTLSRFECWNEQLKYFSFPFFKSVLMEKNQNSEWTSYPQSKPKEKLLVLYKSIDIHPYTTLC